MSVVCLLFALLGIYGSVFFAAMFIFNQREIDQITIDNLKGLLPTQHK